MSEQNYRHLGSLQKEKQTKKALPLGKNHLLSIAINDYYHCPKLYNAVKDAKELIKVLSEKYAFESENIITLFDQEATEKNIDQAFLKLAQTVTNNDNVVIFFSGHGEYDQLRDRGFWVPVNAEQGAYHNYISNSDIRDNLNAINSKHTFLVVDSCFSGSLFATYKSIGATNRLEKDPSRWGLTAGRTELVLDGKPGNNSPFADSLIYHLKTAVKPLSVSELCNKVVEAVISNADQTPRGEPLKVKGHKGGQLIFRPRQDEADVWAIAEQKNTVTAFEHYARLFPSGQFLRRAAKRIHALKEEEIWRFAQNEHTTGAYLSYIRNYKDGKYYKQAVEQLAIVEEEACWKDANLKNTLSAFLEYALKYPEGKYIDKANHQIKAFETAQNREKAFIKEKQNLAVQKAQQEASVTEKRALFKKGINQAEQLFKHRKFSEAAAHYRQSMQHFLPGFAPDLNYIEEKLETCKQKDKLIQLFNDGKKAYAEENYVLAIQYFQKAKEFGPSKKLEDWIKSCQLKLQEGQYRPSTTKRVPKKVSKKKKSSLSVFLGGLAFVVIALFTVVVINNVEDGSEPQTAYQESETLPAEDNKILEEEKYTPSPTKFDLLQGTWYLQDFSANGVSASDLGINMDMYCTYYPNGTYTVFDGYNHTTLTYNLQGEIVNIGGDLYTIRTLTTNRLVLDFYNQIWNTTVRTTFKR